MSLIGRLSIKTVFIIYYSNSITYKISKINNNVSICIMSVTLTLGVD